MSVPPNANDSVSHSDSLSLPDELSTNNLHHDPNLLPDETLQDSDDELLDEEFDEEFEEEFEEPRRKRKRHRLYCFHCNRMENHFHAKTDKWYYSYLLGFSFGIASMLGPFRCVCCGHDRMSRLHQMHPRMIVRRAMGTQAAPIDTKPRQD